MPLPHFHGPKLNYVYENSFDTIFDYNKYYVNNIELFINNKIVHCLIDVLLNKVYNRINLEYIGILNIIDNNIIFINNEEYIYINFKFYNKNDIYRIRISIG